MNELELSATEMRRILALTTDRIVHYIETLASQPAHELADGLGLAQSLREPLPETGEPYERLLDLLFDRAIPNGFNTAGPGFMAYIPGGGLFQSAIADLIAGSVNRYVGVFQAAPGLVQLEANVVRWLCGIVGFPAASLGFLTSGGSLANFTAVVTARFERLPRDPLGGVLYVSDQTHHSVTRAARLAGFSAENIRIVATDAHYRIQVSHLRELVLLDRAAGRTPFMIVGNAGTTNTGAVDDLAALADIARAEHCWLHVDAAYGGFFMLTAAGKATLVGIERSDSITLDPHKGLFLPYGTGALVVRDGAALKRTHSVHADYMPDYQSDPDLVDFCEISPELTRAFRGLRLWLPIKMHGATAFRAALNEKLELAGLAAGGLRAIEGIEILAEPQLSIVAFRLVVAGLNLEELNGLNRRLLDRINSCKRVFLTGTLLRGAFALRICVLSFRSHRDRIEMALQDIALCVDELRGSG